MADFASLVLAVNTNTQASPTWTPVPASGAGTGQELRWSDVATAGATASASWPFMTRPGAAQTVPFLYVFTADTTSLGYLGTASNTPIAYANANYNMARIQWDAVGTFASAPIFTAYASTAHAAIVRNTPTGDILAGNTTDTGATQRSYIKGNMYGSGATTQTPAAAPTNAPVITDGTTGAVTPGAGAWATNYQSLQGDNDFLQYGSTPTATTAQNLFLEFALFVGPNMASNTAYTPVLSVKYSYA